MWIKVMQTDGEDQVSHYVISRKQLSWSFMVFIKIVPTHSIWESASGVKP